MNTKWMLKGIAWWLSYMLISGIVLIVLARVGNTSLFSICFLVACALTLITTGRCLRIMKFGSVNVREEELM